MNKNRVRKIIGLGVLLLSVFVGVKIYQKISHKNQVAKALLVLPEFSFADLQGNMFTNDDLKQGLATVFVYFNSECDYCLHEAQSIRKNLSRFDSTQFVFVSFEPVENIKKFAYAQQLLGIENITFVQDASFVFAQKFDANSIPYLLIYSEDKRLIYKHKGQVKAETILRVLAEK